MMAGNPNWWSINGMHPQSSSNPPAPHHHHPNLLQDFPIRSWSQLLLGGEERYDGNLFQQQKKLENWEDQVLNLNPSAILRAGGDDVKQEVDQSAATNHFYDEFQATRSSSSNSWPNIPVSSPTSCVTSLSNTFLNFSHNTNQDHSSECNSNSGSGGVCKKARVQQSSPQPALKVRKEKLGDRITALHQLVSPFGKTDTASVLSEAIGYIRFLQGQIEALSSPYMRNGAASTGHHQHSFLHDMGMENAASNKQDCDGPADLRSRGLCLVPISCTQHVGNDGGADYWAPAALGGSY